MRSPLLAATALIACFAIPAQALDLGGKDRAGDNRKGKAGISVSVDRNGVGARIGETGARVSISNRAGINSDDAVLGTNDRVSNRARSTPLDGIHGRLESLSDRELVELCLEIEDPTYCSEGDKSKAELVHVIGLGLNKLSEKELAVLCGSLEGCEGYPSPDTGQSGPVPGAGIKESDVTRQLDSDERAALGRRCLDILKRPQRHDADLLDLCVLMRRI